LFLEELKFTLNVLIAILANIPSRLK